MKGVVPPTGGSTVRSELELRLLPRTCKSILTRMIPMDIWKQNMVIDGGMGTELTRCGAKVSEL